jgi:hypothetical protein
LRFGHGERPWHSGEGSTECRWWWCLSDSIEPPPFTRQLSASTRPHVAGGLFTSSIHSTDHSLCPVKPKLNFCPCALLCPAADSGLLPCRTQAHAKPSRKLRTSTKSMYTIYESVAASSKIDNKRKGKRKRWSLQETQHRIRHLPTMTRLTPFQPPRIFPTLPTPSTYFIKNALAASPMARPELHLA